MNKYLILCILILLSLFGFITYFLKKRISNYNEKSDKVKVICYATHPDQYYYNLVESAEKFNYELITLGMGTKWKGFGDKYIGYYDFLKNYKNKEDIILFVDAYDVLLCRDSKDIITTYKKNYNKVVFNCEPSSLSYSHSLIKKKYMNVYKIPECGNNCEKCQFINSGVFIGKVKDIEKIVKLFINSSNYSHNTDDQKIINDKYTNKEIDIEIDYKGVLFGVKCDDCDSFNPNISVNNNRIFNPNTNTYPFVLHGPGPTNLDSYVRLLNLKYYYSKPVNIIPFIAIEIIVLLLLICGIILFWNNNNMIIYMKLLIVIIILMNFIGGYTFTLSIITKFWRLKYNSK